MKKTTVHIISHSHWDREWYMAFEQHRIRLVKLIDDAMELFEKDENYRSFHLDGQTIVLDDYLEIKPQNREKLLKYIRDGRFVIGPWYILQDEFLTSGESNVRNLLVGAQEAKAYGRDCKIGYFPDAFGNAGQMPQLLKQAGMEAVVFGRGVKPIGANNQVIENDDYESPFSEMFWQSPDGSRLPGILFANWYCNGMEIPTEEQQAKKYWDDRLEKAEKFAGTSHLLFMNGCDHQPVQKDLSQAIEVAKRLYPDIEFVHSDFPTYVRAIREEMGDGIATVTGELTGQKTDGLTTLVNTCSNRVDLKIRNRECETALERQAEPMAVLACLNGKEYPRDLLRYAWKTLMQNHPHDSICNCSVDEVNKEMATRFDKSIQVANELARESRAYLADRIGEQCFADAGDEKRPFVVFNGSGWEKTQVICVVLDWRRDWQPKLSDGYEAMKALELPAFVLKDAVGNPVEAKIEDGGAAYGYTLPCDRFRRPYMARQVKVTFEATIPALGYASFVVEPAKGTEVCAGPKDSLVTAPNTMENEFLKVEIAPDGSYTLTDKKTGVSYPEIGWFEECQDVGDEYIFVKTEGSEVFTTRQGQAEIALTEDTPVRASFTVTCSLQVPESGDEMLDEERACMFEYHKRKSGRSKKMTTLTLTTLLTLEKSGKGLLAKTTIDNTARDHRIRVIVPTGQETDSHFADSVFEVVKRPNRHAETWKNPSGCEHQQNFVAVSGKEAGLLVANFGLYEYEILPDQGNAIAVTLLRSTGEMGDWGVYPTPDAQLLGTYSMKYEIVPFAADRIADAFREGYLFQSSLTDCQVPCGCCDTVPPYEKPEAKEDSESRCIGEVSVSDSYLEWEGEGLALTGFKGADEGCDVMVRFVNVTNHPVLLRMKKMAWISAAYASNVLEEEGETMKSAPDGWYHRQIAPYEIVTFGLKRQEEKTERLG
ncbi:MAG: alpha-mannosidase [Fusicatenibacter sp.]